MAAIEQPPLAHENTYSPPRLDTVDARMVALMRCVLTLSGLAIIWIDPTEPARYVGLTYASLVVYCLWSMGLFISAGRFQAVHRYAPWIDVVCAAYLVALSQGTNSVFFFIFLFAIMVASFSRGAWLGAAAGLLAMALALGRRAARWAVAALCGGVLVLALGGAGLLPEALATRLTSITTNLALFDASAVPVTEQNFAIVERMAQIQAGWRMFLAHPLSGVGPGNYTPAYSDFAVGSWYASRGHAHNYYLNMAAEAGIGGVLAYLALLGGVSYQALVALRRANGTFRRSIAVGCCGIIAATAGHDLFENLHVLSMGIQLSAVWGLVVVIATMEKLERVNG